MAQYLSTPGSPPLRVVFYSLVALLAGIRSSPFPSRSLLPAGPYRAGEYLTGRDPGDESGRRYL
ncbi:MAG: hypothetical protein M3495_11270 [Pseudomonadota bacterium]|nr:hypothetical protein [Pseudomonadota bacterium]